MSANSVHLGFTLPFSPSFQMKVPPSFTAEEHKALADVGVRARAAINQQKQRLFKQFQTTLARLEAKLNRLTREYARSTQQLDNKLTEIEQLLKCPANSSSPLFSRVAAAKRLHPQLSAEVLTKLLCEWGVDLSSQNEPRHLHSVMLDDGEATVMTANQTTITVQDQAITPYSRCLSLDEDSLLVTGGMFETIAESASACVVSLSTRSVTRLPPLRLGRAFHAMALVNNKPAVLGGYSKVSLASVEVLENGQWVNSPFLSTPRYEHAACSVEDVTYVVGGKQSLFSDDSAQVTLLNSIDRFCHGRWELLPLKLPFDLHDFGEEPGAVALGKDSLLILGGWEDKVEAVKYDVVSHKVEVVAKTAHASKFPWNCWVKNESQLLGLDDGGSTIAFNL